MQPMEQLSTLGIACLSHLMMQDDHRIKGPPDIVTSLCLHIVDIQVSEDTDGSCRKSPIKMRLTPPNFSEGRDLALPSLVLTLAITSVSIMLTSSILI